MRIQLIAILGLVVLAGCNGAVSKGLFKEVPGTAPPATATPSATPTGGVFATSAPTASASPTATPAGTFVASGITLIIRGTLNSGTTRTFTQMSGAWARQNAYLLAGVPTPSPTGGSFTPSPDKTSTIITGTYQMNSGDSGPVTVIVRQSGSSDVLANSGTLNATFQGTGSYNYINVSQGNATVALQITGPASGTGSIALDSGDSGTISLNTKLLSLTHGMERLLKH